MPQMTIANGYTAPPAAGYGDVVGVPVLVGGRINQPQDAERLLADGAADAVRHDPRPHLRPRHAHAWRPGRAARRHPCLHRLQPGLHRPLPRRLPDLVHPAPRDRSRRSSSPAAVGPPGRVGSWSAGADRPGLKAAAVAADRGHDVDPLRGRPAHRRPGPARRAAARPRRVRWGGDQPGRARRPAPGAGSRPGAPSTSTSWTGSTPTWSSWPPGPGPTSHPWR